MKRSLLLACALGVCASPAVAQGSLLEACAAINPEYSPFPPPNNQERQNVEAQFRFLCGQVVSAMSTVQPTIGMAFSGGAHTLGTATTIGRRLGLFPRVAVTARVNAAFAEAPDLLNGFEGQIDPDGELPPMGTMGLPVGSLQGDVTIGLFNGMSLGPALGGLGSVDLLGSVSFIPSLERTGLSEPVVNWGAGARVGILRQGLIMPGVSVSGMYRKMGTVSFGDMSADDPAEFSSDLSTISLRAGVSKGLLAFDFAAGAGYDIYRSDIRMDWEVSCPSPDPCTVPATVRPEEPVTGALKTGAWNVFGNAGLSLVILNIVGEIGYQKATDIVTVQDLQDAGLPPRQPATEELGGGRIFGSIGVRLTL